MIGDVRDVAKEFKIKKFYVGHQKVDYLGSGEFYSINELTVPEFKEKYGESLWMAKGFKVYLHDIIRDMEGETITIIGNTGVNSVFTILR